MKLLNLAGILNEKDLLETPLNHLQEIITVKGKVQIESNGPTEITVYKRKPREVLTSFVQEKYQGDVVNDIREGDWKNDQPNGKGIFTFEDGTNYIGEFKINHIEGEGERTYPNGDSFIGQWVKDERKYIWSNGDEYEGDWENEEINGTFKSSKETTMENGNLI
jgi:hypothetical protein